MEFSAGRACCGSGCSARL